MVNMRGQKYSYGDLRARAQTLEHRYNLLGLASGDRIMINWARHQGIEDVVAALWACGLRNSCICPWWKDFPKNKIRAWGLLEEFAPRLRVDPDLGEERVYPLPGAPAFDMALAWPARSIEGANRANEPMQLEWITHAQLLASLRHLDAHMQLEPGDTLAWMDPGLGSLGWLSVFYALSVGACIAQPPTIARRTSGVLDEWLKVSPCDWLVPSPDWCAMSGPPEVLPGKGVLSAWGQAHPHLRAQWGRHVRWLDAWAPSACGWWWGGSEWNGEIEEPMLPDTLETPEWHYENGHLCVPKSGQMVQIASAVHDENGAGTGLQLCLSGLPSENGRKEWHEALLSLRKYQRVGDIKSMNVSGAHWVGVVPRSPEESTQHLLEDVKERLHASVASSPDMPTKVMVADLHVPRDEVGAFDVSGLKTLLPVR